MKSDRAGAQPTLVKCLVWDLDETLWQGTLLEDAEVTVHPAVRSVLATLDARGILQSISSRNDHDLAWARLEQLGIAEYFVAPQIGWGNKSDAVARIAEELRFAPETIAFVDDRPAERAQVEFRLPQVRCYPAELATTLVDLPEFSPATVTVDSRKRREMYQANSRREAEQAEFDGPDEEFLRSLDLEMTIERAGPDALTRVEELTLRTSQMNATGVHYSDATLRELLADRDHEVLVVTMGDRYGPHGAVGVVLLERHARMWNVKLLATSCRVVSFGAGSVILNWLVDQAARTGVHLIADFRRTERNRMMDIAYRFAGFTDAECACRAALDTRGSDVGFRRLHLIPEPRPVPDLLRLTAVDLTRARVPAQPAPGR